MNRLPLHVGSALAGAIALLAAAAGSHAGEQPDPRAIRVTAQSVVTAAPDRARVSVSVTSRAPTAREASEANAATSRTVLEKLRAAVKPPGEVKTAGYDLAAEYDYSQNRGPGRESALIGYVATNRFAIVTGDMAAVGALIDAAVIAGANQIDSISFFLDDETPVRRQAILDAGKKARAEAETVAESLGVTLGEVLDASTSAAQGPQPVFAREKAVMMMDAGAPATEVVPGTLEIRASVAVSFAIR